MPVGDGSDAYVPVTFDNNSHIEGPFCHGTKSALEVGEELVSGQPSNVPQGRVSNNVYFSVQVGLSLPGTNKHIGILEGAGPISRHKRGRTTFLTLDPTPLAGLQQWASQFHTHWGTGDGSFENYDHYLTKAPPDARGSSRTKGPP